MLFMFAAAVILTVSPCLSAISHAFPSGKDYVSEGLARFTVDPGQGEDVLLSQRRSGRVQEVSDKYGRFCKYGRRIVRNVDAAASSRMYAQMRRDFSGPRFPIFRRTQVSSEISLARFFLLSKDFFEVRGDASYEERNRTRGNENMSSSCVLRIARTCFHITGIYSSVFPCNVRTHG